MLSVFAIFAVIALTGAFVDEYSKGAEEGFGYLKEDETTGAESINAGNGLHLGEAPEIITGDTILYQTNSIFTRLTKNTQECARFEGIRMNTLPIFCRITHFGFRVTGTVSETACSSGAKYSGFSTQTSFGKRASVPLLTGFNSDNKAEKTYIEIILALKSRIGPGPPYGSLIVAPVFEIPVAYAAESKETMRDWAQKEAKVGLSSPITPAQLELLHKSKEIRISTLKWLQELLAYNIRTLGYKSDIFRYAVRPLVLSADVTKGIMKLAEKFLRVNKTKNETPTFSKSFIEEIARRLSEATGIF